jgi:hypothetical protein
MKKVMLVLGVFGLLGLVTLVPQVNAQGNTRNDFVPPIVFQAAGPTVESIQGTVNQYRAALGEPNNANTAGPLASGRREINWDGGGSATTVSPTPFTGFLNIRGALFTTPGTGFVQAPPAGIADTFADPTYAMIFQTFSAPRLFSPIGSNITEVDFFIPGTAADANGPTPATTTGFGAIFTDVDQPDGSGPGRKRGNRKATTLIEYFGAGGNLLFSSFVPASPGDASLSFFGIVFDDARIARVRITSGDTAPGPDDDQQDIVVMDDFLYGEPQPAQ